MRLMIASAAGAIFLSGCKPLELTLTPVCMPKADFLAAIKPTCFTIKEQGASGDYRVDLYRCGGNAISAINYPEGKICFITNPQTRAMPPVNRGANRAGEGEA